MRTLILTILAFIAGLILGWIGSMLAYVLMTGLGVWIDRDGRLAMGFAFNIGPVIGFVSGIGLAIYVFRRARRERAP